MECIRPGGLREFTAGSGTSDLFFQRWPERQRRLPPTPMGRRCAVCAVLAARPTWHRADAGGRFRSAECVFPEGSSARCCRLNQVERLFP